MGHKFNANSRAKTRCWFLNNQTGRFLVTQFNPTSVPYSRGATYSEIKSPGMSYPLTQFTGGTASEFSIKLFYYDKPYSGKIPSARRFFESLLPPEKNSVFFKKPPTFRFSYGYMVKTLVLLDLAVNDKWMDKYGRPIITEFSLKVRQVKPSNQFSIYNYDLGELILH